MQRYMPGAFYPEMQGPGSASLVLYTDNEGDTIFFRVHVDNCPSVSDHERFHGAFSRAAESFVFLGFSTVKSRVILHTRCEYT